MIPAGEASFEFLIASAIKYTYADGNPLSKFDIEGLATSCPKKKRKAKSKGKPDEEGTGKTKAKKSDRKSPKAKKKKFGENYIKTLESTETGKDIAKTLKEKKTEILPMTDTVRDKYFGKGKGRDALNLKVSNKVYIDSIYSDAEGASHLAHEGQHIVDDAMPYKTNQEILEVEVRAFESEIKVWGELKTKNPKLKNPILDAWETSCDNKTLQQDVADLYYDPAKGTKGK